MGKSTSQKGFNSVLSPTSRSKFLITFLILFLSGIFLGDYINWEFWWLSGIFIGLILALIFWWQDLSWRLALWGLIGLIIGLSYFAFWDYRQQEVVLPLDQEISFEGLVVGRPDYLASQSRYIVKYQNHKIQISAPCLPRYSYGDILKIKGVLKKSNDYYFHQQIFGIIYNPEILEKIGTNGHFLVKLVYNIGNKFEASLNQTLNEPYASFAAGLILGSKRNIPEDLITDFNRTGTTHIIAVSGYNVTIIIVNLGLLMGLFSRKLRFWGSLGIILGFVVMTGAPASVVRAGILTGLMAWGKFEGRRANMTILLLLVASLMLVFNPYALKYDISFQLSFLAFAGLIYLSPIIAKIRISQVLPDIWRASFAETMGAQIMVLPILIYYFGRLSLVSPIANILILWIIPTTMLFVFLIGLGGLIWIFLGKMFGYIGWLFLKYIIIVVETLSKIPWASYEMKISQGWWLAIFYLLIGFIIYKFRGNSLDEKF